MSRVSERWVGRPTDIFSKLEEPEIFYWLFQVACTGRSYRLLLADHLQFKENINVCFVHVVSSVIANTVYYKMAESIMRAIISLDEAVDLVKDKDGILGTDSESEISEDDYSSFINHDSDWVSVFGNGKSLNWLFLLL